jgi:two-component system, chemotaxis family, CheB/CheR fusion protein
MRIRPYRTLENVINGAVMTFVDVTARKRADVALQTSEERFSAIVKQATVGVAETDLEGALS